MTFICHPDLLSCHPELVSGFWSCNCHPPRPVTLNLFQGLCSPQAPIAPHVWYGLRALCQAHRLPPSHFTHLIVFSACAIKIAPFTSLALRSQRRLGTVYVLCAKLTACHLRTSHTLCAHLRLLSAVALSSIGLRSFSPINKHIPSLSL